MGQRANCERVNVLGVGVSAINLTQAVEFIVDACQRRNKGYVSVTGVHGIIEAHDDSAFREILNHSFLCTPDGMPNVWLGQLAGHKHMTRVYGPDLMLELCGVPAAKGLRHFFYGGAHGVADLLKDRLTSRFPGLMVVGTHEPPFRPLSSSEEAQLRQIVREAQPDILWVGLSTPKQERFMAEYLPKLDATIMIGVGAAFDFHAGRVKQAPRWIQRSGFEWLYRVCKDPRRLWKRYARNNPRFVWLGLGQWMGFKKYTLDE